MIPQPPTKAGGFATCFNNSYADSLNSRCCSFPCSACTSRFSLPQQCASKDYASLMCLAVFTTVYGTPCSSDCHSYLHCKYGKQCSGRGSENYSTACLGDEINKRRHGSVTGFDNASLSLVPSLSSQPCCPIFLSLCLDCSLIRLNYTEVLSFIIGMGPGISLWTP